jgi:hypothetical protein
MARVDPDRAPVDRIRNVARDQPELALIAAIVRVALDDAKTGDAEAKDWLSSGACRGYLA